VAWLTAAGFFHLNEEFLPEGSVGS
jgi:hypothetical protein